MSRRRVVVTGVGAVSPYGTGAALFFEGLRAGRSGTRALTLFHEPAPASRVVGEVPGFDAAAHLPAQELRRVPRVVPMAVAAAREAFAASGLDAGDEQEARRIGVIVGTGGGGIEFAERQYAELYAHGGRRVTPFAVSSSLVGMLSSEVSIALGLRGPSHVLSTGCTSSTDAIGYAYRMIAHGDEEALLAGGAEACITPGLLAGFCRMNVVSTRWNDAPERASRPFDRDRDGFVLGEGAWMLVLESEERARARGARPLARLSGYGSTCEAFHRVAVRPDGAEPARAIARALDDAGIAPDAVASLQLHGTGTPANDAMETRAVKLVFGTRARRLRTSALKSMIGHPQGACGAAGVAAAMLTLRERYVPPTINRDNPDPECDLDYTPNRGAFVDADHVVCNTIAFGSKNSALVLSRADAP